MAVNSRLGTTTTLPIFLLALIGTVVADSVRVGNGSESGAQRQGSTPREFMVVTPEKVNAVAGSKIFLPCSYTCTISGVTHTLVEWFRMIDGREERLYQHPNGDRQWPLHATWMGDVFKCDASITASDIKTHDSGPYRCEVTVYPQNKHDIGYLQLNVNSPSELVVVTPDKMDAMAGSTLILPCSYTCTISGVTTKLVEWFRIIDGREDRIYQFSEGENRHWPLQATWVGDVSKCDASITVSDIQTHDSGRYRCEVSVYSLTVQYHIGYLQLTVLPRTDLVVVTPDAKDATVGSMALLPCSYTCTITGIRHTLVEWFRTIGGHDEKVYKIIHRKRSLRPLQVTWMGNDSTCDASITISNIQTHDAGRYRCEVTMYRYDKPSMQDIGYLQLNVHNEPESTNATPTPSPAPAPSTVAGIALGVIAALVVAAGVIFYCRRRLRLCHPREPEAPPHEMESMNTVG
ncbi:cell adhesion molecule DSCAML1-like [Lethenteron reissneri]|uniref:cell adhesion molecule DSCAML1-like n=1 Tax=Lethenteron reissneri TaxID=7753 RepID=UPI002AB67D9E|nr:cell adhesion molecule DSCAML1-like [Lethenteron reissneri]XP_061403515.1 cell adhesion molecule DSCAML1-like [Lethenteron reissneri]